MVFVTIPGIILGIYDIFKDIDYSEIIIYWVFYVIIWMTIVI